MDTLDVTGLPATKVKFLQELVATWKQEKSQDNAPAFTKISRADLPALPDWWQETLEDAKNSPLAHMSDKEIGQWTEKLAERGAQYRQAHQQA